jgi:methionyl-tRNA formyltransferase
MEHSFAFFGTPYPARDTLEILASHGYLPRIVITNPDTPQGRGHVLTPTLTKNWAEAHNIPIMTPERLDAETIDAIKELGCDFAICVAYGKILPSKLIEAFPKGILNVHYSLLPEYRGASPVESVLLDGRTTTGVTIQKMVYDLDAGDIIAAESVDILPNETTRELRPRLVKVGAELLASVLPAYLEGAIEPIPQEHERATHVGKLSKDAGRIDPNGDPENNWNKYRAFAEWPGTYFFTEFNGRQIRLKITKAHYTPEAGFVIDRVIPEGKKEMEYSVFTGRTA